MDKKFLENWQTLSKNSLGAAKELEAINTGVMEKLTGAQMELANATFELGNRYIAGLSDVDGYQDALAEQTKLLTEYNEKLLEAARVTADAVAEAREAYQGWAEKAFTSLGGAADFALPGFDVTRPKRTATKKAA